MHEILDDYHNEIELDYRYKYKQSKSKKSVFAKNPFFKRKNGIDCI